jgi:hypothetical protein
MSDSLLDVFFAIWCAVVVLAIVVWWMSSPTTTSKPASADEAQLELALRLERAETEIHSARKLVGAGK